MNKILIASVRVNGSGLAKKLAEDNPNVQVDLIGPKIQVNLPSNFHYIKEVSNAWELQLELQRIYKEYDFIYAGDFPTQFSHRFQKWKNSIDVPVLCPERRISFLEFNKLTLKKILDECQIPTARYEEIYEDGFGEVSDLKNPIFHTGEKFVLKVIKTPVTNGQQTSITNINEYKELVYRYRWAGGDFFVEEFISGKEISAHFLCNGTEFIYLGSARDYKTIEENDQGENTGSAGCYTPVEYITEKIKSQMFSYAGKILECLNRKGIRYHGIMYLGLIVDKNGIVNVLELNTRPGNPEFNAIVTTIESKNLLENLYNAAIGRKMTEVTFSKNFAVSINILNKDYFRLTKKDITLPELNLTGDETVVYYPTGIFQNCIYANVLRTGKDILSVSNELINFLEKQKLNDFRIRKDVGKLI